LPAEERRANCVEVCAQVQRVVASENFAEVDFKGMQELTCGDVGQQRPVVLPETRAGRSFSFAIGIVAMVLGSILTLVGFGLFGGKSTAYYASGGVVATLGIATLVVGVLIFNETIEI